MPLSNSLRYINKKFINKITGHWAGKKESSFSMIKHTGRKSGEKYQTPVIAIKRGSNFVFALTYGPQVDWYRNVLASSTAGIKYQGKEYQLEKPVSLAAAAGLKFYPQPLRFSLVLLKVTLYFEMHIAG